MITRIILLGPTASGKTGLSLPLAEKIGADIISVDSRQCYKGLDIGTAKPGYEELERVPHYNISILDPGTPDSVARFLNRAAGWTDSVLRKGRRVLYVGGSTLHLRGLIQPFDDLPPADPATVDALNREADESGIERLYRKLQRVDPDYAETLDGLNPQRIIRALGVWEQTGRPFSSFHSQGMVAPPEDMLVVGLKRERSDLYRRINERVDRMLADGLVEETRRLIETEGYDRGLQAFRTVGYRQVIDFLSGVLTHEEMVEEIKTGTRRYAKRQLTWFRRWPFIEWLDAGEFSREEMVSRILRMVDRGASISS